MAINLLLQYPGQVGAVSGSYPFGTPRNVSAPAAGDGTPWEQAWLRDKEGFWQKILTDAGIVPSGTADTALASQYFQALQTLFLERSELVSNGGDILEITNRLPSTHRDGLQVIRNTSVLMSTEPGSARNQPNTDDLVLPLLMQKNISTTWVQGTGNGGLPDGLAPAAGWIRRFIVSHPDGTADLCWDTSPTAANFFADANAIAAGFSDSDLYRRYGWTFVEAGLTIEDHLNSALDPTVYTWKESVNEIDDLGAISTVSRDALTFTASVPPSCFARLIMYGHFTTNDTQLLVTEADQTDVAADSDHWTLRSDNSHHMNSLVRGLWEVNSAQQLFVRASAGTFDFFDVMTDGWVDPAIAP